MKKITFLFSLILQLLVFITFNNHLHSKSYEYFHKGDKISSYFSGIISLNENKFDESYEFFKNLEGLEKKHYRYSQLNLYSLINLGKIEDAIKFSKKLEKNKLNNFESDLIIAIYYLKKNQIEIANEYFTRIKNRKYQTPLQNLLSESMFNWVNLNKEESQAFNNFNFIDSKFRNIKKIQRVFYNCYTDKKNTSTSFEELLSDEKTDFSRYYYFYVNFLNKKNNFELANKVTKTSLKKYPRNLLLNQLQEDLNSNNKFKNFFNCENLNHILAEIFYIASNALSSQQMYLISNFYLSLAIYLNSDFVSYKALYAENIYMIGSLENSKKLYGQIKNNGKIFNWYAIKQITSILFEQDKKEEAINFFSQKFKNLKSPSTYQIFDYAEFLKNNQKFEEAILMYSNVIDQINKKHDLYAEATDGRGISYERNGDWEKAEKDFFESLSVEPNQAYVINYLAYSWIEQGVNIERSLKMLEKANDLRKNDGYIIDSLGWALFKLEKFIEAEKYLQRAVSLMPSDPVINDHYGDSLWMRGKNLQARYYWNYVLNLEKTEESLKKKIKDKLVFGLNLNL